MKLSELSNKSLDAIYRIERSKKKFELKHIKDFLKKCGNPQHDLKAIHIAGTNGKGSVSCLVTSALVEAGYNVGTFTSPHLVRLNERIMINNKWISNEDLDRLHAKVSTLQKAHKAQLTFFETLAVIAFFYFLEQDVNYAVIETGMGGRLCATNIMNPVVTAITNIGKDHTEFLGNTIPKIAREKAAITKKGVPMITSAKNSALKVIRAKAKQKKAKLIVAKDYPGYKLGLKGDYQKENANTAYALLKEIDIDDKIIEKGFKKAFWPGRFHFIRENVLLDCAHNVPGIKALVDSVMKLEYDKLIIIIGMMGDKEKKEICENITEIADYVIVTKADMSKATPSYELAQYFDVCCVTQGLEFALTHVKSIRKKGDLILICGSIFLVGEAISLFNSM